jgi:hypothetical protein
MMDDAVIKKHRHLVEQLFEKTSQGKLEWRPSLYDAEYEIDLGRYIVDITQKNGNYEEPDYRIRLLDEKYETLDEFSDPDISNISVVPPIGDFKNHYGMMQSLYLMILRQVKGADRALDEVLGTLGKA